MIHGRVRHKHRSTYFEKRWRFDHLYVAPKMLNPLAAIAKPAPASKFFEFQIERFTVGTYVAFAETIQNTPKYICNRSLYLDVLLQIQGHIFYLHNYLHW